MGNSRKKQIIHLALALVLAMLVTAWMLAWGFSVEKQPAPAVKAAEELELVPLVYHRPEAEEHDVTLISPVVERYRSICISPNELEEMAAIVFLEAGNQCMDGQQAVAEVILNRVISGDFPDTVHDVIHQGEDSCVPQFSTAAYIDTAEPTSDQYEAIQRALHGPSILPEDVVFFALDAENDRIWGKIGDHVFCRQYIWE